MGSFPFGYHPIEASTWAYLSSLLMLALFFKFNRFWSFRNFDLVLVILLAPGLLMIHYGMNPPESVVDRYQQTPAVSAVELNTDDSLADEQAADTQQAATEEQPADSVAASSPEEETELSELQVWQRVTQKAGYIWLFVIGAIWLVRMLIDPSLVKKPFLEANLSSGGLTFLVCSLLIFLFANIITSRPAAEDISGPRDAVRLMQTEQFELDNLKRRGPGYALFNLFPTIPTFANNREKLREDADEASKLGNYEVAAKSMAILSQLAIVLGLVFFGRNHFGDVRIGIGMAAIYLMLPYTAQNTGRVMHLLPAALLVWSVTMYRVPAVCGLLLGLAAGVAYYPFALIPLFVSYYWERGRMRFLLGFCGAIGIAVSSLVFTSYNFQNFVSQLQAMFGIWGLQTGQNLEGIWSLGWYHVYRIPLLVGFIAMCVTFAAWPARKTLSSLLCCSCAAMVAVQFWHGFGGGLYMAWYLPLALLVFFRPNLEETAALQVLPESKPRKPTVKEDDSELSAA